MIEEYRDKKFPYHCHLIGGHGQCRIIGWGPANGPFTPEPAYYPKPPLIDSNGNLFDGNLLMEGGGWFIQVVFEDGFMTEMHEDMIIPVKAWSIRDPDPSRN